MHGMQPPQGINNSTGMPLWHRMVCQHSSSHLQPMQAPIHSMQPPLGISGSTDMRQPHRMQGKAHQPRPMQTPMHQRQS